MIWINPWKALFLRVRVVYLILFICLLSSELSKLLLLTELSWCLGLCVEADWLGLTPGIDVFWRSWPGRRWRETDSEQVVAFTIHLTRLNGQYSRVALTDHINNTRISSVSQIPTCRTHPDINMIQTNISKAWQKRPQWCNGWALWVFCNHPRLVDWGQTLGKIWNSPGGGGKSCTAPCSHLSWAQHIKCRAPNITWPNLTTGQKC